MEPQASLLSQLSVRAGIGRWARAVLPLAGMLGGIFGGAATALWSGEAAAAETSAEEAMAERDEKSELPVIQNRFFLKQNRFEFGPYFGYVPNNAFKVNPAGGLILAYHFTETFSAEADILYGPDGGYKNLTVRLVQIAADSGNTSFQQPADSIAVGALFAARWSPVYGKINLLGEGVVNFDFYGTLGAGLLVVTTKYYVASANPELPIQEDTRLENSAHPAVNIGIGMNFFINQFIALKIDARTAAYFGPEPDYGTGATPQNRLYTPFVTSGGLAIFVPKMKSRLFNF